MFKDEYLMISIFSKKLFNLKKGNKNETNNGKKL